MSEIAEAKKAARARIRSARSTLDVAESARRADALGRVLEEHVPARARVAAYLPMAHEPDVRPFLTRHLRRGGQVLLPRVADDPVPRLEWVSWAAQSETRRHPVLPLDEPVGHAQTLSDVLAEGPLQMLLPALAVDTSGHRLGQGGGYYDRMFAEVEAADLREQVSAWAVVGPEEVLPAGSFPVEPHDLAVDAVVTPEGLRRLR
ncbi:MULTISPECIES: 5-formyltetrahydrofolate cyclo-ligase [Actinomycetes]|uniref:5-formyltetrahydrofolate cyclo-ligase n=2 Tax=Actinomycetes TaxID=1760 RepID=A0ABP6LZ97_9MICC